jgi:hypothetical protein
LPPVLLTPVANLPPMSLIPVEFATTLIDTGCKFFTGGAVDTCGATCHWYQQHQQYLWHFTAGVCQRCKVDTGGKIATSPVDTVSKFATGVDAGWSRKWLFLLKRNS